MPLATHMLPAYLLKKPINDMSMNTIVHSKHQVSAQKLQYMREQAKSAVDQYAQIPTCSDENQQNI